MGQITGIMLGGAVGALLRFLTSNMVYQLFGRTLPYGTLAVNVIGSFLIGILYVYFVQRAMLDTPLAKGLIVGVLGAFHLLYIFTGYLLFTGAGCLAQGCIEYCAECFAVSDCRLAGRIGRQGNLIATAPALSSYVAHSF